MSQQYDVNIKVLDDKHDNNKIILDILREEYKLERDRTRQIENKGKIFLTLMMGFATFVTPYIPLKEIVEILYSNNCLKVSISILGILIILGAVCCFGIAFKNLSRAISLKTSNRVDIERITSDSNKTTEDPELQKKLTRHFVKILETNINYNNKTADDVKLGIKYLFGFFFLFACGIMLLKCIVL
jgi:hypothetical protein